MGQTFLAEHTAPSYFAGIVPTARARIHGRPCELAVIAGRLSHEVSPADDHQARRELAGEPDVDPQDAAPARP